MSIVNLVAGTVDNVATGIKKSALKNSTALKANLSMAMGKSSDEILEGKGFKKGIDKLTKTVSEQQNRKMIRKEIDNSAKNAIKAGKKAEQEAKENIIDKVKNKASDIKESINKPSKTNKNINGQMEMSFDEFGNFNGFKEQDISTAQDIAKGNFWDNATTWAGEHPIGTAAAIAGGAFGIGLMVGDDND